MPAAQEREPQAPPELGRSAAAAGRQERRRDCRSPSALRVLASGLRELNVDRQLRTAELCCRPDGLWRPPRRGIVHPYTIAKPS